MSWCVSGTAPAAAAPGWTPHACLRSLQFGNCLRCGKILCELEASTNCSFCSSPLDTTSVHAVGKRALNAARRRAREVTSEFEAAHGSRAATSLVFAAQDASEPSRSSMPSTADAALQRAIDRKDRLLHSDKIDDAKRRVFDDQADYFADQASPWLSADERAKAKEEVGCDAARLSSLSVPVCLPLARLLICSLACSLVHLLILS